MCDKLIQKKEQMGLFFLLEISQAGDDYANMFDIAAVPAAWQLSFGSHNLTEADSFSLPSDSSWIRKTWGRDNLQLFERQKKVEKLRMIETEKGFSTRRNLPNQSWSQPAIPLVDWHVGNILISKSSTTKAAIIQIDREHIRCQSSLEFLSEG